MLDQQRPILRYSPRPIEEYVVTIGAASWGPFDSRLLRRPGAWNLAYLSHDYDKQVQPGDSNFTVHVFHSVKYDWVQQAVDLADASPFEHTVASKLLTPAPQFVKWLTDNPKVTQNLPLFQAYGPQWLRTVTRRSFGCHDYTYELEPELTHTDDALNLLQRFMKR